MCYGMNCQYEDDMGECRKPQFFINEDGQKEKCICPETIVYCEGCDEPVKDEDDLQEVRIKNTRTNIFVCKECSEDIENYTLVL